VSYTPQKRDWIVAGLLFLLAGCGGGGTTTGPTAPTGETSFLTGTWSGTVTIRRQGQPEITSAATWTIVPVPNSGLSGFTTTIAMPTNSWLPITITASTTLIPPTPGSPITTLATYTSPRGCAAALGSEGTAQTNRIDATFHGADCRTESESGVFDGTVSLTKTTR